MSNLTLREDLILLAKTLDKKARSDVYPPSAQVQAQQDARSIRIILDQHPEELTAPDLLKWLKGVVKSGNPGCFLEDNDTEIRSVIAKAEGKA